MKQLNHSEDFLENYSWQAGKLRLYIHQNLADAYGYADGTAYLPTDDTYVGRDPRLSTNIMHEGLTFNGVTYDGTDGGGFVGYLQPHPSGGPGPSLGYSCCVLSYFRFGVRPV